MINLPTSVEIHERILNSLKSKLGLSDIQTKSILDAFAQNQAAEEKLIYYYISDVQRNATANTADTEALGGTLERFGRMYLGRDRSPGTKGEYTIKVEATGAATIRAGAQLKSNNSAANPGKVFLTTQQYNLVAGDNILNIEAVEAGLDSIIYEGEFLTLLEPVSNVNQKTEVDSVVSQAIAEETVEDYRNEILTAIQLEPQGGAKSDLMFWSLDAQGVRRVYPYLKDGDAGTTQVYVEATIIDSSDGLGTPPASMLTEVSEVIDFDPDVSKPTHERGRRPIQTFIEALPIIPTTVDVEITGLQDNSASVMDAIQEAIEAYLYEVRPFVDGADLTRNKNDILYVGGIASAVSVVLEQGNFFSSLRMLVDGTDSNTYPITREKIPYLRNVNYL